MAFLLKEGLKIRQLEHIDCAAMLYKQNSNITRSEIEYLIAALEFHFPRLKRIGLDHLRRAAAAKAHLQRTNHTVPLVSRVCRYFGATLAIQGSFRMGFGIALQQALALRPVELRKLKPEHVMVPVQGIGTYIIPLGADVGTKVKREQYALLDSHRYPDLAWLLLQLLRATPADQFLFPQLLLA